jgi:hypothetical protein
MAITVGNAGAGHRDRDQQLRALGHRGRLLTAGLFHVMMAAYGWE